MSFAYPKGVPKTKDVFPYPRGIQKTKVFFVLMTDNYCSIDFVRYYRTSSQYALHQRPQDRDLCQVPECDIQGAEEGNSRLRDPLPLKDEAVSAAFEFQGGEIV